MATRFATCNAHFVELCREMACSPWQRGLDGSKFKAVNSRDKN